MQGSEDSRGPRRLGLSLCGLQAAEIFFVSGFSLLSLLSRSRKLELQKRLVFELARAAFFRSGQGRDLSSKGNDP